MPLHLVTGRVNAGKTGRMHGAVRDAAAAGRAVVLVVPTQPDAERASAELSLSSPRNVRVVRFERLVETAWVLAGDGRRLVTPAQRTALVSRALREERLSALPMTGERPGLISAIEAVVRARAESGMEGAARSAALRDLQRVASRYGRDLAAKHLVEPGEATLRLAADGILPFDTLVVHRFSDLSSSQEAFLTGVSRRGADVWVSLPWEAGFPATRALDGLRDRLAVEADDVEELPPSGAAHTNPGLAMLEDGLFGETRLLPRDAVVRFCVAAGEEAEAALAAGAARSLIDEGFEPEDVAVVFRDVERRRVALRSAFDAAGVPADHDVAWSVSRTPLGRALVAVLRCAAGAGDRRLMLAYLRGPFCDADQGRVDDLDARWREERIDDSRRMTFEAARLEGLTGAALRAARKVVREPSGPQSLSAWKRLVDALFVCAWPSGAVPSGPDAEMDAAAHRAILEVTRSLSEIGSSGGGSLEDVLTALDGTTVTPSSAERPGHVQVTEAHRLRGRRFGAVILGGLTANEFSPVARERPETAILERLGLGTGRDEAASERLLYYSVVTRARRRLVLMRTEIDSEDTPVRPSLLWEETLDLFRDPTPDAADEDEGLEPERLALADLVLCAPASGPRRRALRAAVAAGPSGPQTLPTTRGELRDPRVLGALASRERFSATEIQMYVECPYRWFYERAVEPSELDREIDARTVSTLAHRALSDFYRVLPARLGVRRVTRPLLPAALELADEVFDAQGRPRASTLEDEFDLDSARRRVRTLVTADADLLPGFEPLLLEHEIGGEGAGVRIGDFLLSGRVDRVDRCGDSLVVIDYKWSSLPTQKAIGAGTSLQVALYALAVDGLDLGRVVGGIYRSLAGDAGVGFRIGDELPPGSVRGPTAASIDDEEGPVAMAVRVASGAVAGMRAGRIDPMPASHSVCGRCAAAPVCEKAML